MPSTSSHRGSQPKLSSFGGGDWNHPLRPPLAGFTVRGSECLIRAAGGLGLTVHTENELAQPTRYGRSHAIDHITSRHPKQPVQIVDGAPHSTHDAYVVEPALPGPADAMTTISEN